VAELLGSACVCASMVTWAGCVPTSHCIINSCILNQIRHNAAAFCIRVNIAQEIVKLCERFVPLREDLTLLCPACC
jgi:hypothetical protein